MNRNEVLDVLKVVAAATRRTIGEPDVAIWLEILAGDRRDDALRAVKDHLSQHPGVWLEPGHVHQRVRAMVRERMEREPESVRDARMEALSAKAADDIAELAERKQLPTREFRRPTGDAKRILSVRCPWPACHAPIGKPCAVKGGAHPSRVDLGLGRAA